MSEVVTLTWILWRKLTGKDPSQNQLMWGSLGLMLSAYSLVALTVYLVQ